MVAVRKAGFAAAVPLTLAAYGPDGPLLEYAAGVWPAGHQVTPGELFYGASLTKQVTGVAIALLVQAGRLDPDAAIGSVLSELHDWPGAVTPRQLLHHVAGFPPAGAVETGLIGPLWNNAAVMEALPRFKEQATAPKSAFAYSNAGYVCLGRLIERLQGVPFDVFVRDRILAPLALTAMRIHSDAERPTYPQTTMMGPTLPLSTGDGGLWTTASAFALWLDAQNRDSFRVASLVEQNGYLSDATPLDYGWGIGLRSFRGVPCFSHGGGWAGARAKATRCPALGLSVVALAADDSDARISALVDAVMQRLADGLTASDG